MFRLRHPSVCALLCAVVVLSGCASLAEHKTPYEPSQDKFADLTRAATQLERRRAEADASAAAVPAYLDAGVTLSNVACEIWFTGLARTERDTTLTKDLMNVVGNLILGISGINGANANSIGRGALGLAAANTAFEVYQAEVLLGSIEDIRGKIRDDRKVGEAALLARTDVTFDAAQRRLLEYHQLCSVERIKLLLSTSLSAVKFERPDTTLATPVDRAKAASLVTTLKIGNVDALLQSDDLLYQTYLALAVYPTADDADPEIAKAARKNQVVAIYASRFAALATAEEKEQVLTTLQQIAVLLKFGDRLKADLAAGATERQAEARRELDAAEESVNIMMSRNATDPEVARALNMSPGGGPQAPAFRADRNNSAILKAQLGAARSHTAKALAIEIQRAEDAAARLQLATASADRARAGAAPVGGVTPRIVPIGQQ